MKQKQKTILIDSSNLLHRTVWIAENVRTNVNPAYIFLTSIKKYAEKFNTTNIYSIWDKRLVRGIKNYRRLAKQTEYKAGRDKERSARVFSYEDKTTEIISELGVKNMYPGILEADDVIAWLSKKLDGEIIIVSVDQDMLQLVNDRTTVYSPIKDIVITSKNFKDIVGVDIDNFLRYKSLIGDKSDNLPGVTRCGHKTAIKLLNECPTDDQLNDKLGEEALKPYYHNLEMIDLEKGHEHHPEDIKLYVEQLEKLKTHKPDLTKFKTLAESLNMNKVVTDINKWSELFSDVKLTKTLEDIVNNLGLSK